MNKRIPHDRKTDRPARRTARLVKELERSAWQRDPDQRIGRNIRKEASR